MLAFDLAYALAAPLALGACLGLRHGEMLARITVAGRLWVEAERAEWRAPRLAARARRAAAEEHKRASPHLR